MSQGRSEGPAQPGPRSRRRPGRGKRGGRRFACCAAAGLVLAAGVAALPAAAQVPDPHASVEPGPDVPAGDGTITVQVVHRTGGDVAGLELALYALSQDGSPGLRSAETDAAGRAVFQGVSRSEQVVYLVGARYQDLPFGARVRFAEGQEQVAVRIEVSDPVEEGGPVAVAETEWLLEWMGDHVRVRVNHALENPGDQVIQVPPERRAGRQALFVDRMPAGAEAFGPAPGSFGEGIENEGREIRYWGPLYPGRQRLGFQYQLPLGVEAERREVALELPAGARSLRLITPEQGLEIEALGLAELEAFELEGRRYRVWGGGDLAPGARFPLSVRAPEANADARRLAVARADLWVELDDAAAIVSEEWHLQVAGPARLVSGGSEPLLDLRLPAGAEPLGFSPNAGEIGLEPRPPEEGGGFALRGPLAPGATRFGLRYRLALESPRAPLSLERTLPRDIDVLNLLVADTGVVIESDRLHRRRPTRSGTRLYLHREAFQLTAGETLDLRLRRLERSPTPRWASVGVVLALAALGVFYALRPLQRDRAGEAPADPLESEREAVIESLRDLDHDYETGKLSEEDYERMRRDLRARAVALMRRDEGAEAATAPAPPRSPAPSPAEAPADRFCSACGRALRPEWAFCAGCGAALDPPETQAEESGAAGG